MAGGESKMTGKNKEVSSVRCSAANCVHHAENNCCTAQQIAVGRHDACRASETACETFCMDPDACSAGL